jgi:hypothetical protein
MKLYGGISGGTYISGIKNPNEFNYLGFIYGG